MSNEIQWRHTATGATLYTTIRSVAGTMWSTAGTPNFEALTVANWADYKITMTETPASSYFYVGTFPPIAGNMVAGWYFVDIYSGSAGISDTLVATMLGYWNGTTFKPNADDTVAVGGTVQTAHDLGAGVLVSVGAGVGQVNVSGGVVPASGNWNTTTPPTAAAIVTALWTDLLASTDFSTALSIGKLLKDNIDAVISAIPTSKTGYSLAATGLDAITATEPTAKPTTFPGWLMWLVQWKRRASKTPTAIVVRTEAGTTVTTQAITDDGAGTETLGPPA